MRSPYGASGHPNSDYIHASLTRFASTSVESSLSNPPQARVSRTFPAYTLPSSGCVTVARGRPSRYMEISKSRYMYVYRTCELATHFHLYVHFMDLRDGRPFSHSPGDVSSEGPYSWLSMNSLHLETLSIPSSTTKERVYIAS